MTEEPTFEESLKLLEEKVELLSRGDLPLDRALAVFEEGLALFRAAMRSCPIRNSGSRSSSPRRKA